MSTTPDSPPDGADAAPASDGSNHASGSPLLWSTIIGIAAGLLVLRYMRDVLIPFALAALLFYALDPAVDRLQRWRIPRGFGAILAIGAVLLALGTLGYSLQDDVAVTIGQLPRGARQFSAMLRRGPSRTPVEAVQEAVEELQATPSAPAHDGVTRVEVQEPGFQASTYLWARSGGVLSAVNQGIMVLFLTYFMLLSDELFKRKLVELGPTLTRKKITVRILEDIATQIERFFLVQICTSLLVGVATWLALRAFGLEQAPLWGLLAGVFNSIPYYGPLIVTGGLSIVAFLQFGTIAMTTAVAGVAIVITTLEGTVLTPALMGRAAQMNYVTVFAGLLFWSWAWGLWGLLLAVPLMMVIKSVCDGVEDLQPIGRLMGE
jgi:predicted PurR-regulated permease PerM